MLRLLITKEMLIVVGIIIAIHAIVFALLGIEYETHLSYYLGELGL